MSSSPRRTPTASARVRSTEPCLTAPSHARDADSSPPRSSARAADLGRKYGVKGYPTIKYFPPNSLEPVDYASARDLDSLAAFVTKQTGLKSKVKAPPPSLATFLDASNHDSVALDADKDVLVAYTAPWCGVRPVSSPLAPSDGARRG
jgi:hypothetical protein